MAVRIKIINIGSTKQLCPKLPTYAQQWTFYLLNNNSNVLTHVQSVDSTEFLVDVTTIDANNPSNGFSGRSGLTSAIYPEAASVIAARRKWDRYRFLLKGSQQELVPFVLEVQGRWGHNRLSSRIKEIKFNISCSSKIKLKEFKFLYLKW